jgi:hypothetical protein
LSKLNVNQLELFNQILAKIDKEEDLENNSLINTYQLKQDYLKIKNNYFDEISKEILLIANNDLQFNECKKKRPKSLDNSSYIENQQKNKKLKRSDFKNNSKNNFNNFLLNNNNLNIRTKKLTRASSQDNNLSIPKNYDNNNNYYNIINNNLNNKNTSTIPNNNNNNNLHRINKFHSKFFSQNE